MKTLNIYYLNKDTSHCPACWEFTDLQFYAVITDLEEETVKEYLIDFVRTLEVALRNKPDYLVDFLTTILCDYGILIQSCEPPWMDFEKDIRGANEIIDMGSIPEEELLGNELFSVVIEKRRCEEERKRIEQEKSKQELIRQNDKRRLVDLADKFGISDEIKDLLK